MRRLVVLAAITFVLGSLFASRAEACAFTDAHAVFRNSGEGDFRDWGLIFEDARGDDYWCAISAYYRLTEKLDAMPDWYWQQFLSGEYVMLVSATGLVLGGRGNMTPDLDYRIKCVIEKYRFAKFAGDPCGWAPPDGHNHGNTCMDDYAIAASGYAWSAAYLRLSGRDWTGARWNALDMIHQSFNTVDAVCIYNENAPLDPVKGPCNACSDPVPGRGGTQPQACIANLGTPGYHLLSLNDGIQTPVYGIGLMANISAAFMALEYAQASVNVTSELSADERKIIGAIFSEAQEKSQPDGSEFTSTCYHVDVNGNPNVGYAPGFYAGVPCWDLLKTTGGHHRPAHYPLRQFYTRYGLLPGTSGFAFNAPFPWGDYAGAGSFHEGRSETYSTLANDYYNSYPRILSAGSYFRMSLRAPSWWPTYYLNATPGSALTATSESPYQSDSQFVIVDLNGGILNDGDPVGIQLYANQAYWLSAVNGGGGAVTATATSAGPYERFTIRKLAGLYFYGPIANNDNFALQTYNGYYLHADNAGGSTITANATSAGAYETFNYVKVDDACYPH